MRFNTKAGSISSNRISSKFRANSLLSQSFEASIFFLDDALNFANFAVRFGRDYVAKKIKSDQKHAKSQPEEPKNDQNLLKKAKNLYRMPTN